MKDVLLLATTAALFAFGWFLMGEADRFFASSGLVQGAQPVPDENTLRLGFYDPVAADIIAEALEPYSRAYPDRPARIFYGSEKELRRGLAAGRFDVIFLPENAEIPAHMQYNAKMIFLDCTSIGMRCGGLPIEPVAGGRIAQRVVWIDETAPIFVGGFVKCLEERFAAPTMEK